MLIRLFVNFTAIVTIIAKGFIVINMHVEC